MKGLELSEAYYREYGEPMLQTQFEAFYPYIAAGLFGNGSECLGFDDELSRDHDFEPGFMLILPGTEKIDTRTEFQLERAYDKLPKEFMGFKRQRTAPVGGRRHGVFRLSELLERFTGTLDGCLEMSSWLTIPEQSLLEITSGRIFFDPFGAVTEMREKLSVFPRDILLKKLAGELLQMNRDGQYNYERCLQHGEAAAAQWALFGYARSALHVLFLLQNHYMPYYKWAFRAARKLGGKTAEMAGKLEQLLLLPGGGDESLEKTILMAQVNEGIVEELQRQELTDGICSDLEKHAYHVNDLIREAQLRNMHILAGVNNGSIG